MDEWFDLHEKIPQLSCQYLVMLKGIDGQPDEEAIADCEVMFDGTVRWKVHGVYESRVVRWKALGATFCRRPFLLTHRLNGKRMSNNIKRTLTGGYMKNNLVHLCDSCCNCYPECSTDGHNVVFGDGKGNDNICCCNKYEPLIKTRL